MVAVEAVPVVLVRLALILDHQVDLEELVYKYAFQVHQPILQGKQQERLDHHLEVDGLLVEEVVEEPGTIQDMFLGVLVADLEDHLLEEVLEVKVMIVQIMQLQELMLLEVAAAHLEEILEL
jgi:hypothetical protein